MSEVNQHYLDHVVTASASHEVEVTQDIVTRNGMKLLAKGSRVDAEVRDRLLQHKLSRPLEDCVAVAGGISGEQIRDAAQALLDRHPLLAALGSDARAQSVALSLGGLKLAPPMQSLLTVYAEHQPDRLAHCVGVALLAMSLGRRLRPGDIDSHRLLATAGLLHDVGELYIAPAYLQRGTELQLDQWKHIASHPVSGHHVLREMEGAGQAIAELVLSHHERLDGFGYPRGLAAEQLSIDAQILACAEWLMGLIEAGSSPVAHASVATRLMPGEFSETLLQVLRVAGRASDETSHLADEGRSLHEVLPRAIRVAEVLQRFRDLRLLIQARLDDATPELSAMLALCSQRMQQLQASFSSAGLDLHGPQHVVHELAAQDPELEIEVVALVREFSWRMRELKRAALLRSGLMSTTDQALVQELIGLLEGVVMADTFLQKD
ncbi:MAG: HD domain-containing protein [Burkholderiaceae bacterium]|nr:HD domain-containing protein [Burkholderiaceae bacterium]